MNKILFAAALILASCTPGDTVGTNQQPTHSWSNYHWARTVDNFPLPTIDSLTTDWKPYLQGTVADWSSSGRVDLVLESGSTSKKTRRRCKAPNGKIRVCNLAYGFNGWLGLAGISIDSNNHIISGYTKLNDSYFNTAPYADPGWKQSVTCQEVGHNLGLGHQDEDFNNVSLLTCMDYQNPPTADPNAHDYEQLDLMYGHLDSYDTYSTGDSGSSSCNAPPGRGCNKAEVPWGTSQGRQGQKETFTRHNKDGTIEVTRVTWVDNH